MRIDELRETLHEHGGAVEGRIHPERLQQVHGRIRTARRRRNAGVVAGTAATVAAIALAVLPNLQPDPAPAPAGPDPVGDYSKGGVTFRDEVLGERLLGAGIGDPGQSTVSFDFVVGDKGLRFSPTCHGTGPARMVAYAVEGDDLGAVGCSTAPDPDPGAAGATFEAPPEKLLLDWGLEPGDTATLTARLVATKDADGPTVEDPDAVIGVGVYEDTRATQVVAGVELAQRVEHEGRVWSLAQTQESASGDEALQIVTGGEGAAGPLLWAVAVSGLDSPSSVDLRLDGRVDDSILRGRGVEGPTWMPWRSFDQTEVHELRIEVTEGLTGRARLAFVGYRPVD